MNGAHDIGGVMELVPLSSRRTSQSSIMNGRGASAL